MVRVAIAYTTKNRTDYTKQTLPRILDEAEGNFDLYWLDGSTTKESLQFPHEFAYQWREEHGGKYPLKEFHTGIGGGAAAAIQQAFLYLMGKDVDYIGLIENDVLLEPGWFEKTMELFSKKPFFPEVFKFANVGAVSARCFKHRIIEKQEDYAIMADVGAGMVIFKKELIPALLENFRRPALWEVQALCRYFSGYDYPTPKMILEQDPKVEKMWCLSEDWFWPIILMSRGFATLATVPCMTVNLDDVNGERDPVEK